MDTPPTLLCAPKLLLVEDHEPLRDATAEMLRTAGYRVVVAADGLQALELWERERPALVMLDVNMPRLNGWETLGRLRARSTDQPVMMLTGLGDLDARVRGLGAGADDYLAKPWDRRELIARVGALLRRSQAHARAAPGRRLRFGAVTVDLDVRAARSDGGATLALTKTEFALLEILLRHVGRPVSRDVILDSVWGYSSQSATRTVETHVWRLRHKLGDSGKEPQWIKTAPASSGYILAATVVVQPAAA